MIVVADLAAYQAARHLILRPGSCLALTFRILRRTTGTQSHHLQPSRFSDDKSHGPRLYAWMTAEGNPLTRAMPPKQATLGYVKSSQQTLGCRLHCCSHHASSYTD
jgi:hypothetical protein